MSEPRAPSAAAPQPAGLGPTGPAAPGASAASVAAASLLRAAWLAILLGFAIEALVLLSAAMTRGVSGPAAWTADLAQKVSWSVVVCVGLALARTASRAAGPAMAAAGLLAAPLAFVLARGLHKGVSQALGLVAQGGIGPSPTTIAILKGIEYAALGLLVGWIAKKAWGGLGAHAAAGLAVGLVFGGAILTLTFREIPELAAAAVLARTINELVFPVGCALVLYASDALGQRLS